MLEQAVGMPLLSRSRNDIQLTPAGQKLLPHAESIVNRWTQAQHEVVLHEEERTALSIAAVPPVSDLLFAPWIRRMWDEFPDVALTIDILSDRYIAEKLIERSVDAALTFDPPSDKGLKVVPLQPLRLRLMSTKERATVADAMDTNYVYVDWGTWFNVAHAKHFPTYVPHGLRIRSPNLAFDLLANRDGSCYLPTRLGSEQTNALELYKVEDAPAIEHAAYAVYANDLPNRETVEAVLELLLTSEG